MKAEFFCYDCNKNDPIGRIIFLETSEGIEVEVSGGELPIFIEGKYRDVTMEKAINVVVSKLSNYLDILIYLERVVYVSEIIGEKAL